MMVANPVHVSPAAKAYRLAVGKVIISIFYIGWMVAFAFLLMFS